MNTKYCSDSDKLNSLKSRILEENKGVLTIGTLQIDQAIKHCCKNGDDSQSDEDFERCVYNTLGLRY